MEHTNGDRMINEGRCLVFNRSEFKCSHISIDALWEIYAAIELIYLIFNHFSVLLRQGQSESDNRINTRSPVKSTYLFVPAIIYLIQHQSEIVQFRISKGNPFRLAAARATNDRVLVHSGQHYPKILCDFHSLHSYFYWNSLMSGSPQRNYWIFVVRIESVCDACLLCEPLRRLAPTILLRPPLELCRGGNFIHSAF